MVAQKNENAIKERLKQFSETEERSQDYDELFSYCELLTLRLSSLEEENARLSETLSQLVEYCKQLEDKKAYSFEHYCAPWQEG